MKKMPLLSERLEWAKQRKEDRVGARVTWAAMAEASKSSPAAVSRWKNNQNGIAADNARPLADFLEVDPIWLETGEGSHERVEGGQHLPHNYRRVIESDPENSDYIEIRKVKLKLSAGITGFSIDEQQTYGRPITQPREWFISRGYNPKKLIAIEVKGDSMEPTMSSGDIVVINTADTTPKSGATFAINYEGEDVIKRMLRDFGRWFLSSDNPDQRKYHKQECSEGTCLVVGRVVLLQRENI